MAVIFSLGLPDIANSWRDSGGLFWRQGSHGMGCDSLVFSNFSNPLGNGGFLVGTAFHADVAWHSRRCSSSLHEQYDRQVIHTI